MTDREFNEGLQRHLMRCELQYRAENAPKGSEVDWLAPHCGTVQEIACFLRELGFRIKEISDCSDCAGTKFHWVVTTGGLTVADTRHAPCKGCPDRYPACSDHCQKPEFLAFRADRARIRETQRRESELLSYTLGEIRKNRRGRR